MANESVSQLPSLASMHWWRPSLYLRPSSTLPLKVSTISTSLSRTMYSCQANRSPPTKETPKHAKHEDRARHSTSVSGINKARLKERRDGCVEAKARPHAMRSRRFEESIDRSN